MPSFRFQEKWKMIKIYLNSNYGFEVIQLRRFIV